MGVILMRHPPVDGAGLCYGRHDPPLAPGWDAAATAAQEAIRALPVHPEHVLTSPAPRCRRLAASLATALFLPLTEDDRLRELDFGAWEGRPWDEIPRGESNPWAEDPITRAPPGGESFTQLTARVSAATADLSDTLVITHAGPIRALWTLHDGLTFAEAFSRPVPYATPLPLLPSGALCDSAG